MKTIKNPNSITVLLRYSPNKTDSCDENFKINLKFYSV